MALFGNAETKKIDDLGNRRLRFSLSLSLSIRKMDSLWDDGDQWLLLYCISFTIANLTVLNLHNWSITRKSPKVADKSIDTGTFSFATLPPIQTRDSCVSTVSALSVDGDDADEESDKISQGCQTIRSNIHSKDASAETGNGWIDYFMLPKQLIRRQRKRSSFKRRAHGEQRPADYHWLWSNLPYRSTAAGYIHLCRYSFIVNGIRVVSPVVL